VDTQFLKTDGKSKILTSSNIGEVGKVKMNKIDTLNSHKIINTIFSNMDGKERNQALNMVDDFIVANLGIEKSKLPWLNSCAKKRKEFLPWVRFLHKMRITYARLYAAAWDESIVKH